MPIRLSAFQLPSGAPAVRVDCVGTIVQEDAEGWLKQSAPGSPFYGLPVLAVAAQIEHVEPGARSKIAQSRRDTGPPNSWIAVVVTSPVLRVTTNFVMRVIQNKKYRSFETEEKALAWLDERVREEAARPPG